VKSEPVLLLRPDKAGDAIKSLPAIRALKLVRPDLSLHVLASGHNYSLFEVEPGITVHELPEDWEKWPASRLRSFLFAGGMPTQFHSIVNLLSDFFPKVHDLLRALPSSRKYYVGKRGWNSAEAGLQSISLPYHTPQGRDETKNIADILATVFGCSLEQTLNTVERAPVITDADRAAAAELIPQLGQSIGLCPFAGTVQRSPNLKRWKKLLAKVSRDLSGAHFVIFCPEPLKPQALQLLSPNVKKFTIVSAPSFRALAACFERLDAVMAVDSGPLHLAQAMGVPSLGFLSGGDRARWFARTNPKDRLLRRGLFSRFPSSLEMWWAFRRWVQPVFSGH
jgi:ADP-heptose:LPS heptosyltransferase